MPVVENIIIPEVIEVKYPDFNEWPLKRQVDVFTDELVADCGDRSIEVLLMETGVSMDAYKKIKQDSTYGEIVKTKSRNDKFTAKIPEIYKKLADDAAEGDMAAIKMIMQSGGELTPEAVTIINQNLTHMDMPQLQKELKQLLLEAQDLDVD